MTPEELAEEIGDSLAFPCTTGTDGGAITLGLTFRRFAALEMMASYRAHDETRADHIASWACEDVKALLLELAKRNW